MQAWKDEIDKKIGEHTKVLTDIFGGLEHYRGTKSFNIIDERAFKPLEKGSNAESWRQTLTSMQIALKNTRKDSHEDLLATKEIVEKIIPAFMDLKSGYEILGKAVLELCDVCGVSFDSIIEKHVHRRAKEMEYVKDTQDPPISEAKTSKTVDNSSAQEYGGEDAFFH